jgi:hypothetical protein
MRSDVRHVRVGYLHQTWGEITLDAQGQPQFGGPRAEAIKELYMSLLATSLYHGLSPAEVLRRMTQRLTGLTWAVEANNS